MAKALVLGVLVFLILVITRTPAGLIRSFIPDDSPTTLLSLNGTIWNGDGDLLVDGMPVGHLAWNFRPGTLLNGAVGYGVSLTGGGVDIQGSLAKGFGPADAELQGTVAASFVNQWLAPYYIELSGTFELNEVVATIKGRQLESLSGRLTWDGGPLQYKLSGNMYNSVLPPMTADLGPGSKAIAYATGESTPLLHAELKADGFARIGVTKYLTRILGEPWPGGDPDHAVVLEVEEQVF